MILRKVGSPLLSLLFVVLLSCEQEKAPYILEGTLQNFQGDTISIQLPVEGKFFYRVNLIDVPVDSITGYFKVIVEDEVSGFTSIYHKRSRQSIRTWVNPGFKDSIYVDFDDREAFLSFGNNADAINLLNSWERFYSFSSINGPISKYYREANAKQLYDLLTSKSELEISEIDSLVQRRKMSRSLANVLKTESEFHWKSVFASATYHHYYFQKELNRDSPFNHDWRQLYLSIMDSVDFNRSEALSTNYFITLSEAYYRAYPRISGSMEELDSNLNAEEKSEVFQRTFVNLIKDKHQGEQRELLLAYNLNNMAIQDNYQRVLIDLYDEFIDEFPESKFEELLDSSIEPIRNFHKRMEMPLSDKIILLENAHEFTTFEEIVEPYKGEVIYINMWATWCAICKPQFQYQDGLKEFIDGKPIRLMYLSSDKEGMHQHWKDMLNYYQLEGINLRVSQEMNDKIWSEVLGLNYKNSLRYIIIDRDGNLVVPNAAKPSEGQKLYDQLAKYL